MRGILSDVNIQGQVRILAHVLESDSWRELWRGLGLTVYVFADLGLTPDTPDSQLWEVCQEQQLILITSNRNAEGPDSLEATIGARNTPESLPVFTVADAEQIRHSREYADRVVESLLDALFVIDNLRGTGRIYLP